MERAGDIAARIVERIAMQGERRTDVGRLAPTAVSACPERHARYPSASPARRRKERRGERRHDASGLF